jgi:uncharacterized protein YfbU (UPF0304 family)
MSEEHNYRVRLPDYDYETTELGESMEVAIERVVDQFELQQVVFDSLSDGVRAQALDPEREVWLDFEVTAEQVLIYLVRPASEGREGGDHAGVPD